MYNAKYRSIFFFIWIKRTCFANHRIFRKKHFLAPFAFRKLQLLHWTRSISIPGLNRLIDHFSMPRSSIDRCSSLLPRNALNFPSELSKDMRPLRNWQIPPRVNSLLRRKKDISLFTPRLNPFTRIFTFQLVSIWRKKKKGQFLQSNFLRRENNFNGKNIKMYIIVFAIVIFSWYFLFKHLSFINGSLSVNETRNRIPNTSITVCFVALQNPRPVGTNGGPTTEFQVSP